MTPCLRLALVQQNFSVGDVAGNSQKLRAGWAEAKAASADLVIASEMCVSGYPVEDLAIRPAFLAEVRKAVEALAPMTADGPAIIVGAPWLHDGQLFNAALLLAEGTIKSVTCKYEIPNYACFDERRTFVPGALPRSIRFRDYQLGLMICEDMWQPEVSQYLAEQGAEILIVINGSPYAEQKRMQRLSLAALRSGTNDLPLIYVNQLGGQDELVFDGGSFAMQRNGKLALQLPDWKSGLELIDWFPAQREFSAGTISPLTTGAEGLYQAIHLGLQDYVQKNGFRDVWLGLSGGVDSALVSALAVDALGVDHVHAVMMPSPYTAPESLDDAVALAKNLGIKLQTIPITEAMQVFDKILQPAFQGKPQDVTEENIQARCRGLILMALANKHGGMVLATGNKSEMAVGYSTLYGDMCGGYAPLKDLYKTRVYELAAWRGNIPANILTRAPTAELRPGQKDQDSLPPYDLLDRLLHGFIEEDQSIEELVRLGHDPAVVTRIWTMLQRAEYKRRQSAPGPKLTKRHLSKDRRYPITDFY